MNQYQYPQLSPIQYDESIDKLLTAGLSPKSSTRRGDLKVYWDTNSDFLNSYLCISSIYPTKNRDSMDTLFIWSDFFPLRSSDNEGLLDSIYNNGCANTNSLFGDVVLGGQGEYMLREGNGFQKIRRFQSSEDLYLTMQGAYKFCVDFLEAGVYQNLKDIYDAGLAEPIKLEYSTVASMKKNAGLASPDMLFKWQAGDTPYSIIIRGEIWQALTLLNNNKIPDIYMPTDKVDRVFMVICLSNTEENALVYFEPTVELEQLKYWLDSEELLNHMLYKELCGYYIPWVEPPNSMRSIPDNNTICGLSYSKAYKCLRLQNIDYESIFWDEHLNRIYDFLEFLPDLMCQVASSEFTKMESLHLCKYIKETITSYGRQYGNIDPNYLNQFITELTQLEAYLRGVDR